MHTINKIKIKVKEKADRIDERLRAIEPPHDEDIEMANLNLLIRDKTHLEKMTEAGVNADCFYSPFNKDFYTGCVQLLDNGNGVDLPLLKGILTEKHLHDSVIKKICDISDFWADSQNDDEYINKLVDLSQRRKAREEAIEALKGCYNGKFKYVNEDHEKKNTIIRLHKEWIENSQENSAILTPFHLFNAKTGGIKGLTGLLAIPKCGKSTMCMQIGHYAASQGTQVLYCDFENGVFEILKRTLQAGKIIQCERPEELDEMVKNLDPENLRGWAENYHVYDTRTIRDPESLKARIPKNKKCLVIIDSLQKMPMLCEGKRESIDTWLISLNALKSENCHILFISEMNRAGFQNRDSLTSGKESSGIEYTADSILRLLPGKESGIYDLNLLLSRNTASGTIGTYGLTKYRYFVENPDLESFKELRLEEETQNSKIIESINELGKQNPLKRVYISDLSAHASMEARPLGRIVKSMGYITKKDSMKSGAAYFVV